MNLAQAVRSHRAIHNWTQDQLAEKIGITRQTIHSIEQSKTSPSYVVAKQLSTLLEFSIDSLSL